MEVSTRRLDELLCELPAFTPKQAFDLAHSLWPDKYPELPRVMQEVDQLHAQGILKFGCFDVRMPIATEPVYDSVLGGDPEVVAKELEKRIRNEPRADSLQPALVYWPTQRPLRIRTVNHEIAVTHIVTVIAQQNPGNWSFVGEHQRFDRSVPDGVVTVGEDSMVVDAIGDTYRSAKILKLLTAVGDRRIQLW